MDWEKAKKHFDTVRGHYQDLEEKKGVDPTLALSFVFDPLIKRYELGERTQKLYDEMMAVE